jgi:hypothetical protein
VNSGQLYLKNSTNAQRYLGYMMEMKADIIRNKDGKLDQDYVANASDLG